MLLVASDDKIASIWNLVSGLKQTTTPHVTSEKHSDCITGGAFLGDESHVITVSCDGYLYIWRTSDGVLTAQYECGADDVRHSVTCSLLIISYLVAM